MASVTRVMNPQPFNFQFRSEMRYAFEVKQSSFHVEHRT